MAYDRSTIKEGQTVYTRDGHKLGKVIRCSDRVFEIEKGYFFPKEYVASYEEIRELKDDRITLTSTRDEIQAGYTADMGAPATTATGTTAGMGEERLRGETTSVPLAEEELEVDKLRRKTGEVHLRKEVHTEERQVTVPVTREEVHVERVPATGATRGEATFEGGETSVPVYEEEVEVTKRPVIREEVRVTKEAHREEKPIRETVRKEEVEIDRGRTTGGLDEEPRHP